MSPVDNTTRLDGDMDQEKLRKEFRALRKALGTQQEVANMLGCSVDKVRGIEQAKPTGSGPYPVTMETIYALRYLIQNREEDR